MLGIVTAALPSQVIKVSLPSGQNCVIALYEKSTGLYIDLTVNNVVLLTGVLCLNRVLLVRQAYLGFVGDLAFIDLLGLTDPVYSGLGTRYQLTYLTPTDVQANI